MSCEYVTENLAWIFSKICPPSVVKIYSSEEGKVDSKITCLSRRIPAITIPNHLVIPLTPLLLCNQKSGSNFPLFSDPFGKNASFAKLNKTTKPFLLCIKTDIVIFFGWAELDQMSISGRYLPNIDISAGWIFCLTFHWELEETLGNTHLSLLNLLWALHRQKRAQSFWIFFS